MIYVSRCRDCGKQLHQTRTEEFGDDRCDSCIDKAEIAISLPNIPIPYSPRYEANRDRYGNNLERCLLCAHPVITDRARVVLLTDDLGMITAPVEDQSHTGGCFYIGPDCWKANPQLHPYEVK